jgi:heparosan-N-sulfate-glucuronate 5-epimerase
MRRLLRVPQLQAPFRAGDPLSGYYNDMTGVLGMADGPEEARERFAGLVKDRRIAHPIAVAQLGLGAWQQSATNPRWLDVVRDAADWLRTERDESGRILFRFALPHTYSLASGWASAMAQGEAASLLVRAATALDAPEMLEDARIAAMSLMETNSPLVAQTRDGPVLQEYPTTPPSHVLNGWIFALWGLYDVAQLTGDERAAASFENGVDALAARLPLYSTGLRWSRYDLFPHRIVHVASPFYHRLHIEQLRALDVLASRPAFNAHAAWWETGLRNPAIRTMAVTRKIAFRVLNPRRRLS